MKYLKSAIMGMTAFAVIISFSGLALADTGCGVCKEGKGNKVDKDAWANHIKVLRDSAAALATSDPTLAKGLNDLADKKTEMIQKRQELQDKHAQKMDLLKDSAKALAVSNPVLSKELEKMCEMKHMKK
ncbi:MAG: hypothetical protein HQL28_03825 [Candidatus Omnitrophica bacterium]|nr:hypothetical protein [Candidatus Omnitrophota bacterium]